MKRRDFSLLGLGAVAVVGGTAVPLLSAQAQTGAAAQAGRDYKALSKPAPVEAPKGKIEVLEFFSYGCSHCKDFEPMFERWFAALPKDVVVQRVHVGFNKSFEPLQRIFYALEALGQVGALHAKVFTALQTERKALNQESVLFDWVASQGVDRAKFADAYKSFGVASKVRRANQLQEAYKVEGTPALGVAGRAYIDPTLTRGFDGMLRVAEQLIAQERKRG